MTDHVLDPLSYTSSARLKVLLAPVRPIKRSRFRQFCSVLREANLVRLDDVSNSTSKQHNYFNPRSLPAGRIVYEFVTEVDQTHAYLESLEPSRRILAVILIGDARETLEQREVKNSIEIASRSTSSSILSRLFLFDSDRQSQVEYPPDTFFLSSDPAAMTGVRDALSDFSSMLLSRVNDLFIDVRERTNIESPYDPASDFIRTQPERLSAYALGDARATLERSASPAPDRGPRFSLPAVSSSTSERAKMQGHGRASKVCGDLLLVCGFCNDARQYYAEAAAIARANNDYLWQGAALEGIGVCLVLSTYLELPFLVPVVALSCTGQSSTAKAGERSSMSSNKSDVNLIDFLPELHSVILSLYQKSSTVSTDQVPPFVLAESPLRLAKFLSAVHLAGGLNRHALDHIVLGKAIDTTACRPAPYPPRAEIAAWAMRSYQGPMESLSLADKLHIFAGLASILGAVGYKRRRALFLREIVMALIPALVQARVTGAAGMGIHPAASLALSENQNTSLSKEVLLQTRQSASSLSSLLHELAESYGIPRTGDHLGAEEAILGGYGWPFLQDVILRDCIAISEAIPDFDGVLQFSVCMLEVAAAGMGRDEQVRIVSNIPRILGAARRSGMTNLEVNYWDRYLVKQIKAQTDEETQPVKRVTSELLAIDNSSTVKRDPFLYNPYTKKSTVVDRAVMVQDEPIQIEVTLQNPFEFDVEAQHVELLSDGVQLDCTPGRCFVKAQSLQRLVLQVVPRGSGELRLTGCRVKMSGCCFTTLLTLANPTKKELESWHLHRGGLGRIKRAGLDARFSELYLSETHSDLCLPQTTLIDVVPPTPTLVHEISTRRQPITTISMLEGETSRLEITLRNISPVPVNFLAFSFTDSTMKPLEQAINSRNKQAHEIYELETFLYHRKAMTVSDSDQPKGIAANDTETFHIEVRGKRGFTSGEVIVNYGQLPALSELSGNAADKDTKVPASFYTRQLRIPVKANVTPSIDIVHCDVLPITFDALLQQTPADTRYDHQYKSVMNFMKDHRPHCLMVLDLRNMHSRDLRMSLSVTDHLDRDPYHVSKLLPAGSQHRFMVPLLQRSIAQDALRQPVPSLSNRQFVVSSANVEAEALALQVFWSREDLLSRLQATWSLEERQGEIEKRAIALSPRMIKNVLVEDVRLCLVHTRPGQVTYKANEAFNIALELNNDTTAKLIGLVRLQIMLGSQEDVDLGTRLILHGTSQFPIELPPGSTSKTLMLTAINSGRYKILASMEVIESADRKGETRMARALEIAVVDEDRQH